MRKGIEKEYWVAYRESWGYRSFDIQQCSSFLTLLKELDGDLEYQRNVFELRTNPGAEEKEARVAESVFLEKQKKLIAALKEIDPNIVVFGSGTYQGQDDPTLENALSQSNSFWQEFQIVFPGDAFTRYATADQVSVSIPGQDDQNLEIYNYLVGLSPLLIYSFSTSSAMRGQSLSIWNRRLQLLQAKKIQGHLLFPGTYPLSDWEIYHKQLEKIVQAGEAYLAQENPLFFTPNGKKPGEVIAQHRGSKWDFRKLFSNQVVRLNLKDGLPGYLEIRCIDAQECTKMTIALSVLVEHIAKASSSLEKYLPQCEEELRYNLYQAIHFGPSAKIQIAGEKISLAKYAQKISEIVLGNNDCEYTRLLKHRLEHPAARRIVQKIQEGEDIVALLVQCLEENKTIYEV